MRLTSIVAICIAFTAPAVADNHSEEKGTFKQAYAAYQTAVKTGTKEDKISTALKAYKLGKTVYQNDPETLAKLAINYGLTEDQPHKAITALKHAYKLREDIYGENSPELAPLLIYIGNAKARRDRRFDFYSEFARAGKVVKNTYGANSTEYARFNLEIGKTAYRHQDRSAIKYLNRAEAIFSMDANNANKEDHALSKLWQGKYYLADENFIKATDALLYSLSVFEETSPNAEITLTNHAHLIEAYEQRNLRNEATAHCQAIGRAQPQADDQDYLPVFGKQPTYPRVALDRAQEGYAIVELTVDEEGFVKNPMILESEGGKYFETASLRAINEFRYIPRFEDGKPVETNNVTYKFSYKMRN
ncbi:energy transducer TonB [Kordiimonas laminariae]|uniref:energy transducer TonB n=1 Tax=Kordiimonas laminariae TaxID=2917717 RepID=UPI001FF6B2A5|nr:energy transducer TonB [Kordiimonas laminariae]MCK0068594.1 energy transducer TonB [Kordiimonas laminariae]